MYNSIPHRIQQISERYPHNVAQYIKDDNGQFHARTYQEFMNRIYRTMDFLRVKCGVAYGDHIGIISDNRPEWLEIDLSLLGLGAVDIPRGSDTNSNEIAFVLKHSDSVGVVFEDILKYQALLKISPGACKKMKFVLFINTPTKKEIKQATIPVPHFTFDSVEHHTLSNAALKASQQAIESTAIDDIATIIYTSGTTDIPKGVCLTHRNFLFQIDRIIPEVVVVNPGDVLISILPVWHSYERAIQYIVVGTGSGIAYSKPIGKILLADILMVQANYMSSVPRIWEGIHRAITSKVQSGSPIRKVIFKTAVYIGTIHAYLTHMIRGSIPNFTPRNYLLDKIIGILPYILLFPLRMLLDMLVFRKIRKLLGKKFKAGISGGGALPKHIDTFFQAAKITVLDGYGLTETAPVLAIRTTEKTESDGVGKLLRDIEYKVLTPEGGICQPGEKGVLHIRSEQIMKQYYKNTESTQAIISKDGYLDTGDLVCVSPRRELKILGRQKDTIVLLNGKNVEPEYVENMVQQSPYIDAVVLLGQDEKFLGALIIPNEPLLIEYGTQYALGNDINKLCTLSAIRALFRKEINNNSTTLNTYEKINRFVLIPTPLVAGIELTQTLKLKRDTIEKKYQTEIKKVFE